MASNGNISHAEMWDDSALVDSWNDALEEYKKYHSIQARGEDISDILGTTEDVSTSDSTKAPIEQTKQSDIKDQQAKEEVPDVTASGQGHVQANTIHPTPVPNPSGLPALPQHLIGQVHDEGLKNLLMSWYYAGYYTGLYEGQRKE